ncbi:alpha/beta hydrolase [Actinomycetospora sp. NBRC 106378]|uniref:alpha/beta fold hydrolase n=1 Tax=Actinomycetospora sp. NBRC 106378 TaxID=3032208 RepID=UPI0024A0C5EC|nr:alpha/beta hydrolase [Actinomycetospora sp. NBRC 106378]GLZ53420.1 alpha/beta hydrolase [Actinomycetospora sp. NBRC 106378]
MTSTISSAREAQTQFVDVEGTRFAYRELGVERPGEPPLVLLQRFRAEMDDWDPLFLDTLAARRRVVIFNNRGVGSSEGETPSSLEAAADDAAAFIRALGIGKADLLGWSMGGMTSPIVAHRHPELVRRLVLTGTCPPGNPESAPSPAHWLDVAAKPSYVDDDILYIFFTTSETSLRKGRESLARMDKPGQPGSSVKTSSETKQAQIQAIGAFWANEQGWFEKLKDLPNPTLVANGDTDVAFPITDSVILFREIPNSQLSVYRDANHGFLFQEPVVFAQEVLAFLDE